MSQWGRKIYQSWPSRHPVWTISAFFGAVVFFMLAVALQYARSWSFVERFYLPVYATTWMHGLFPKAQTRYSLIAGLTAKGQRRNALADEVEAATNAQGQTVYVLTEEGRRNGLVRLVWNQGLFNDRRLHEFLGHWIYRDQTVWDYIERPAYAALGAFLLLLFVALPRDRARWLVRKHGRRLRGPELVTTAEFNRRHEADGMAFVNEERGVIDRLVRNRASRWVRMPRVTLLHRKLTGQDCELIRHPPGHCKGSRIRPLTGRPHGSRQGLPLPRDLREEPDRTDRLLPQPPREHQAIAGGSRGRREETRRTGACPLLLKGCVYKGLC